jgi:hypothetical protein
MQGLGSFYFCILLSSSFLMYANLIADGVEFGPLSYRKATGLIECT